MASLQRSRYGVFHLSFRYAGSRFLRSLETSDEIEARDEKALVERSLRHLKTGVLKLKGDVSADELWQFLRSGGQAPVRVCLSKQSIAASKSEHRLRNSSTSESRIWSYSNAAKANICFRSIDKEQVRERRGDSVPSISEVDDLANQLR